MKKLVSVIILMVMLLSVCAQASYAFIPLPDDWYTDVDPEYDWFFNSVKYVSDYSLMVGTSDTKFSPDEYFSRAMLVTVLWRLDESPDETTDVFTDVPGRTWFSKAVAWGYKNNIVAGVTKDKFSPYAPVTREQMAAMFKRYADYLKINTSARADLSKTFADANKIGKWAKSSVEWAVAEKLIYGISKTTIYPYGYATRAQSAAILQRFCQQILPKLSGVSVNDGHYAGASDYDIKKSDRLATEQSLYNFDQNPIVNRERKVNTTALPSFDIDKTAFVRNGTKLSDLKDKTLEFFTADDKPNWSYRNEKGIVVNEWQWFDILKDEIGLSIKYNIKQSNTSLDAAYTYMNSGLQCDLLYTNKKNAMQAVGIARPITNFTNINNLGSAPGVSRPAMDNHSMYKHLYLVSPIGPSEVLWYNQTLNQELALSDPHIMWEKGKWDWDNFKKYIQSVPKTNKKGEPLVALTGDTQTIAEMFALANGKPVVKRKTIASISITECNLNSPKVIEAFEFFADISKSTNYAENAHAGLFEGTTIMDATLDPLTYHDTEYSKYVMINWVPFPSAENESDVTTDKGYGMLLPRKTAKPENELVTLKFMELWSTRFTEAFFDVLTTYEYFNFNYKQRKQYFDFILRNNVASMSGVLLFEKYGNLKAAITDNTKYSIRDEIAKHINDVKSDIKKVAEYGN